MHQPGAHVALLEQGQVAQVVRECVYERTAVISVPGMHHQPGGLVDDQQVVVLVGDFERDIFGDDLHFAPRVGHHDLDTVERLDLVARFRGLACLYGRQTAFKRIHRNHNAHSKRPLRISFHHNSTFVPCFQDGIGHEKTQESALPSCVWYFMKLLEGNGLCGLVFLAGAGLALGLDLACGKQGALCEGRADELIHKHGEQHDVTHDAAVCKGRSG